MSSQYEKRKKKDKKPEVTETEVEEVVVKGEIRKAYDVFFDAATRRFIQVCIEYDLVSGTGTVVEAKAVADSQPVAIQKLGIVFSKKILNIK